MWRLIKIAVLAVVVCPPARAQDEDSSRIPDISEIWTTPETVASRSRITSTPSGDVDLVIPIELPDARYRPSLSFSYGGQRGDDLHLATGWALSVHAIVENPVPGSRDPFFSPDGALRSVDPVHRPDSFAAAEDHTGHKRAYERDGERWTVTGKSGEVWTYSEHVPGSREGRFPGFAPLIYQENAFGDYIDYKYHADGRIQRIEYGASTEGDDSDRDVIVIFDYEPRGCSRSNFRSSPPAVHADRLSGIKILVDGVEHSRWSFQYDDCPDRLTRVSSRRLAEPRVWEFDYADGPEWSLSNLDNTVFDAPLYWSVLMPQDPAPRAVEFGYSVHLDTVAQHNFDGVQGVRKTLHLNGDALLDVVEGDGGGTYRPFTAIPQVIKHLTDGSHAFVNVDAEDVSEYPGTAIRYDSSIEVLNDVEGITERRDAQRTMDLNGDGFTDSIEYPIESVSPGDRDHTVFVSWGGPDGPAPSGSDDVDAIDLPPSVRAIGDSLDVGLNDSECRQNDTCGRSAQEIDLVDWDADGYVDIVQRSFDPEHLTEFEVYSWVPALGAWGEEPQFVDAPWCNADSDLFAATNICALRASVAMRQVLHLPGPNQTEAWNLVTSGWVDMNGDGLVDYVTMPESNPPSECPNGTICTLGALGEPWQVYLNEGGAFAPAVAWGTSLSPASIFQTRTNLTTQLTRVVAQTADVNGDGLLDAIDLTLRRWYENTGDPDVGFLAHSLTTSWPSDGLSLIQNSRFEPSLAGHGGYMNFTTRLAADWNGDGALDYVDAERGRFLASKSTAYLLTRVTFEAGETRLAWRSSGEAFPSGLAVPPNVNAGIPDASNVTVPVISRTDDFDPVTNKINSMDYKWLHPTWDPFRRRFVGFAGRVVEDVERPDQPPVARHRTTTIWHTGNGYNGLPISEKQDDPDGGSGSEFVNVQTTNYRNMGCSPDGPCIVVLETQRVSERRGGVTRAREVHYDYDRDTADIVEVHNLGEVSRDDDDVVMEIEYATGGINGRTLPCVVRSGGWLPVVGGIDTIVERRFEYDDLPLCQIDRGAPSANEVDRTGPGIPLEVLRTEYDTTPYGQITLVRSPSCFSGLETCAETTSTYDAEFRFVEEVVNAVGHVTSRFVDLWGQEQSFTSPSGVTNVVVRDGRGRVTNSYRRAPGGPLELLSRLTYVDGAAPSVETETLVDGVVDAHSIAYVDAWGVVVQTRRELDFDQWLVDDVDYDPTGAEAKRALTHTGSGIGYTRFPLTHLLTVKKYDSIGRWVSTRDPLGNVSLDVPLDPWTTSIRDAEGHERHEVHDARGLTREVFAERDGVALSSGLYDYDPLGRLLSARDPDDVMTSYVWASTGELLSVTSPDFGTRTFAYSSDGYLTDQYDSAGHHIHMVRDAIGRLTSRQDAGLTFETYTWDTLVPGQLTSVADRAGLVTYAYDSLGRRTGETRRFLDNATATRTTSYDDQDRILTEINPDGVSIRNRWVRGRLFSRRVQLAGVAPRVITLTANYDSRGRFTGFPLDGWKLSLVLTLDDLGRTQKMQWRLPYGGGSSSHTVAHSYAFARNGLIQTRTLNNAPINTTFAYDAAARLESAAGRGDADWFLSDGGFLDGGGLDEKAYLPNVGNHRIDIVVDAPGDRSPWRYEYDDAGEVTGIIPVGHGKPRERLNITYDGLGRPISAWTSKSAMNRVFDYQGSVAYEVVEGRVIKRMGAWESVDGESRTHISLLGTLIGRIVNGTSLIATMPDIHATPATVVTEGGLVQSTLELDPYGSKIASTGTTDVAHNWLDLPRDSKLGLVSMGARLFDERSRTFLSPDPAAVGQGAAQFAADPYLSNPYGYSRWNGLSLQDRDGRYPLMTTPSLTYSTPAAAGFIVGFGEGVISLAYGIGDAYSHPISTAYAIGDVYSHPIATAQSVGSGAIAGIGNFLGKRDQPFEVGRSAGQVAGPIVVGAIAAEGLGAAMSGVAPASNVGARGFTFTKTTGGEMLREAVGGLRSMRGSGASAGEMADAFQGMAGQISKADSSWSAARLGGTDASHIFAGELDEALVISPQGGLFRGNLRDATQFTLGLDAGTLEETFTPVYSALKEIK
jgi:RHS repeat-associated protein